MVWDFILFIDVDGLSWFPRCTIQMLIREAGVGIHGWLEVAHTRSPFL